MKRSIVILTAMLMMLCACGDGGSQPVAASATAQPTQELPRIGISIGSGTAVEQDIAERAEGYAAAEGYALAVTNAGGSAKQQEEDIYSLIGSGAQAIIISPADMDKLSDAVEACIDADIPVIDLLLPINATVDTLIAPDYYLIGRKAARLAGEAVVDNELERGNVFLLETSMYGYDMQLMHDGFIAELAAVAEGKELKLTFAGSVNFEPQAQGSLEGFSIEELPDDVNIVFAQNAEMARALLAMKGERALEIITVGGDEDIVNAVKSGEIYASLTMATDAAAKNAVEQAVSAAESPSYEMPHYIDMEPAVISASSVDDHLQALDGYAQPLE